MIYQKRCIVKVGYNARITANYVLDVLIIGFGEWLKRYAVLFYNQRGF